MTTVDARISPMPNSRTTRETSLPPPLLGISRGAPPSRRGGEEAEEGYDAPLAPPACCRDASRRATGRRRLSSSQRFTASCPLTPPLPFVLYASPPICLLFASWLSRRSCCRAAADSASRLCLDLFLAIWLLQLPTPHLSRRRCLSSSSRLCLATRRLRLLTRPRLITGCVVARCQCPDVVAVDAQASLLSS